jgi:glycosyltransferase involved in cell wall biosynthesis
MSRVHATVPSAEILVVDDGSTDDTRAAAGHVAIVHAKNRGKGAALRNGIQQAIARDAALLVTIDADGQHPAEEIPRLLQPLEQGRADLVLGARKRDRVMPISRRMTNWLSATLASRIGGQEVRDAQTGFRAFTRTLAQRIQPIGDRYEYEANFLLDAMRAGYQIESIDVPTIYGPSSHFRTWHDTWLMARAFARHAIGTT